MTQAKVKKVCSYEMRTEMKDNPATASVLCKRCNAAHTGRRYGRHWDRTKPVGRETATKRETGCSQEQQIGK